MAVTFGYGVPVLASPGIHGYPTPGYVALDPTTTMRAALRAETSGYDALWVADHLMLGRDDAILEGWTVISALAAVTQRARLGVLHQSNLLRHPALAAKMAATLDQLSGGRLIYYPDAGNNRREHRAYGLPWSDDAKDRITRMVEGLELTLALWKGHSPVSFIGQYYRLDGAVCSPAHCKSHIRPYGWGGTIRRYWGPAPGSPKVGIRHRRGSQNWPRGRRHWLLPVKRWAVM